MECLKCGANVLEENATFCHECGARLDGKIACARCGQFIDEKYAYCAFCGAKMGENTNANDCVMQQNGTPFFNGNQSFEQQGEQSIANENGKSGNKILSWARVCVGMALTLVSLVFVFLIGFQVDLTGQVIALSQMNFDTSGESIKLFYYFSDAYKEIELLKEVLLNANDQLIVAAYIHSIMGTVICVITIGCVIGFATTAIVNFVMFFKKKRDNNSAKWAVRTVIAYLVGCFSLKFLNYCFVDINLVFPQSPSWGEPLTATISINFDIVTKIGLIACIVGVALYAILSCIKQGLSGITKAKLFKFGFGVLGVAFAIVVCAVGQNAIVGTTISLSEGVDENITFSIKMAQLSFVSFLCSALKSQAFPIMDPTAKINMSSSFAVVQEITMLGIIVCSLCAIASQIFATEGKAKGAVPFAILTVAFSVAQLISGIVSHSVMQDLYGILLGSDTTMTTALILGNSIITLVFAVLLLATSIINLIIAKPKKAPPAPQD